MRTNALIGILVFSLLFILSCKPGIPPQGNLYEPDSIELLASKALDQEYSITYERYFSHDSNTLLEKAGFVKVAIEKQNLWSITMFFSEERLTLKIINLNGSFYRCTPESCFVSQERSTNQFTPVDEQDILNHRVNIKVTQAPSITVMGKELECFNIKPLEPIEFFWYQLSNFCYNSDGLPLYKQHKYRFGGAIATDELRAINISSQVTAEDLQLPLGSVYLSETT